MQLSELTGSDDPTLTQIFAVNPVVEPLDGPISIDDLMDRFPEEVYQQGRDTHLYRFLVALCGDSGAGLIKRQLLSARLKYEAEFLNAQTLDDIYASQFQFHRLASEIPPVDLNLDAVTPEEADAAQLANQTYYSRAQEFFTAVRYGNSPLGLATAAQAATGSDSDLIEHYKYVFDQYSDLKLGIAPVGTTTSTSEFVIQTRSEDPDLTYENTLNWEPSFTPPTLTTNAGRPVPLVSPLSVARVFSAETTLAFDPAIERNVVDVIDRLRPTSTLSTVDVANVRLLTVSLNAAPFGSSERTTVSRFVTGRTDVNWPDPDSSQGFFVQTNTENEATSWYGTSRELPAIFHTISGATAYSEGALLDSQYGSDSFYSDGTATPPLASYLSEHTGAFFQTLVAIFPFLAHISSNIQFSADKSIAAQNTPLIVTGKAIA